MSSQTESLDAPRRRFVTLRSVALGAVMSAVIGLHAPYWTIYLQSSRMYADYHTGGAAFWLFVILLLNVPLLFVWRRMALRAEELMVVAGMMFISGSIASSGLIAHFVPTITSAYYRASTGNRWHQLLWPNLKDWMSPLDPNGGTLAIKNFWEGVGEEPIPWRVWFRPLALWGVALMAIFSCMTAIMSIMRKQWVDHEHLTFPIAQVPAELCAAGADPLHEASIFRSKAFWLGVGLTFMLASIGGISFYLTGEPIFFRIRRNITGIGPLPLRVNVSLVVIGLVFLIPNRVAFSVGTLVLLGWVAKSFAQSYGLGMDEYMLYGGGGAPELQFSAMGAMTIFVLSSMWLGRGHLKRVLSCALGVGHAGYDADEPTSYRMALVTLFVGAVVYVFWLRRAGLGVFYGICLLLAFLIIYYGMARVIAQCGLPSASAPILPSTFVGHLFGGGTLGGQQATVVGSQIWHADMRNGPMSGAAHGMYLVERRRRGLFWALLLALLITYAVASACTVWISYRHAALNMDHWFFINSPNGPWRWTANLINQSHQFNLRGLLWTGVGAGIMAALVAAQRAFFWWPIHPVAFLIWNTHMVYNFWVSIFLAWGAKVAVVNLGGYDAYRKGRRFCIGMVLGYFIAGGLWGIIDTITGAVGDSVFYI